MRWEPFWMPAIVAASLAIGMTGHAQEPSAAPGGALDRVAVFKQSLQQGLGAVRRYQWIETTSISVKGEEKSRKQQTCLYGADGEVVKTPIGQAEPPQQPQSRGRGGGRLKQRVVETKKGEMADYMERAVALIHHYVPPTPDQIRPPTDSSLLV